MTEAEYEQASKRMDEALLRSRWSFATMQTNI